MSFRGAVVSIHNVPLPSQLHSSPYFAFHRLVGDSLCQACKAKPAAGCVRLLAQRALLVGVIITPLLSFVWYINYNRDLDILCDRYITISIVVGLPPSPNFVNVVSYPLYYINSIQAEFLSTLEFMRLNMFHPVD